MAYGIKDRLFGLHMTLEVSTILRPLVACTRMVALDAGVSGKALYHTVIPKTTLFDVECQLPCSLNKEDQYVVLTIVECDRLQRVLFQTELSYHWIKRQKMLLKQRRSTDSLFLSSRVDDDISCQIKLIRVGALVASRLHPQSPSFNISSYTRLLETEILQLRTWSSLHIPPDMDLPVILSGVWECPLYSMMMMADHIDQIGFSIGQEEGGGEEGGNKWSRDVANTWRMIFSSTLHATFWTLVDHLCCNVTSEHHTAWMGKKFPYPQTNTTTRNQCDVIGSRMVIVDLLYQAMFHHKPFQERKMLKSVGFINWLQSITDVYWPFIGIVKGDHDNFTIICGLGKKEAFKNLVTFQRHCLESEDFILLSVHGKQQLCLVVWRDYKEEVVCVSLLQTCSDIGHLSYDVTHDVGIDIVIHDDDDDVNNIFVNPHLETIFSKTLVRSVCQAREICHKTRIINGAPALRPWLNSAQALLEVQQRKTCIDWHKGWVSRIDSQWEREHTDLLFDRVRQLKVK